MMPPPQRRTLNHELREIQDSLLRMGILVEQGIGQAIRALQARDLRLARKIIANDGRINGLRFHVEKACLACMATQQPMASDLRAVVAGIIIASELERMGDYVAGMARVALRLGEEPWPYALPDLPRMAAVSQTMVRQSLDAYLAHDEVLAQQLAARDDELDDFYKQLFQQIQTHISTDPVHMQHALQLLFVAHNLERIGDRVVNIAERVIFMTSGELCELNAGPEAPVPSFKFS